ncbi:YqaA family protein [Phaeovulum vinaykumarii]|uniref:Membrane protein YqaA, SNARE-associated domain n=1 Tax=Phaeovulum vinaykumarii TaxID=407234 RepID=A0A1N7JIA2_9RHOB|nr:YqaA family protein [Phaeovulum vinaykumarii]SIS49073.1 membrane protein YqaA, SNARE-associated domain [Phaeovulum vinaykumarii]SOB89396.1 membrane protein YqaA with SNARE-associated domain [Phaeovulum vinaykumarii]
MLALLGLFSAALLAATLLPAQSEAVLVAMVLAGGHPVWLLLTVATTGNVLGSLVNWTLGRGIVRFEGRRWFPASPRQLERATLWYHRWGHWSLLASWVPIIGDPLTLVAGVLREPLWRFLVIVTLAKAGRYLVLVAVALDLAA